MGISFDETTDPSGLEIHDSIEQRHLHIRSASAVEVESIDPDEFLFPVDAACRVETTSLTFDIRCFVSLHNENGECIKTPETGDTIQFGNDTRFIGLDGPVKLYCRIDNGGKIETGLNATELSFDEKSTVTIGARSHHEQPIGTIQTPKDPEAMMRAISLLSSALKTTSPERSWPSLRGHPPLIKCGQEFNSPAGLSQPSSDLTLTVPPTYRDLYSVAPLAFYLNAKVRPGEEPSLTTSGFEYQLGSDTQLENEAARLLKHVFLLDCIVRTEYMPQTELYERKHLEDSIPFDLENAYHYSLSERLEQYLEVPFDTVAPYVPDWPVTAHIPADAASVEIVPYIVNELGIIRNTRGEFVDSLSQTSSAESSLRRSTSYQRTDAVTGGEGARKFIAPEPTAESLEHAWFGDHIPLDASKATIDALESQLTQDNRSESIEILLVCNDARMLKEHDLLGDVYGDRDQLPFDVHSEFGITMDQLETLLSGDHYDFLHFIGHATPDGLECSDGKLDIRTIESVNVGVFFLNACQSYEQGLALARRGAFGGVSTLDDVINENAVEVGETMARLLNRGFPLRASLSIAQKNTSIGDEYLIVGDGSADVAQPDNGAPVIADVEQQNNSEYRFSVHSYSTKEFKLGSMTESTLRTSDDIHLTPRSTPSSIVSKASLEEYLTWTQVPVLIDGDLHWNDGIVPYSLDRDS